MVKELDALKIIRLRNDGRNVEMVSLQHKVRRRYNELRQRHSRPVVLAYFAAHLIGRIKGKFMRLFGKATPTGRNLLPQDFIAASGDEKFTELLALFQRALEDGHIGRKLMYAIRITGGLGDALIIARLARDLQNHLDIEMPFDVFFQNPKAIEPFFKNIKGFRKAVDIAVFPDVVRHYAFGLLANQFVTFVNEHMDFRMLLLNAPQVLNLFGTVQKARSEIERYITNHPFLDGAFADQATRHGHKRYKYLHEMLGIPYGGDLLNIDTNPMIAEGFRLVPNKYITIHDGWDTKFKLATTRPTKTIPLQCWAQIVAALKVARPDLQIVQLGGKTGKDIPGVDLNLKNKLSFEQSASILAGSRLHFDSESGLVHLGAAFGVRSVVLFGPTNIEWFSYPQNINIPPSKCGNCWWSTDTWMDVCPVGHEIPVCTAFFDVPGIIAQTLEVLDERDIKAAATLET